MKNPKFNFVPERQLTEAQAKQEAFKCTISESGVLFLRGDYVKAYEMNGKTARLFVDTEKKVIGWSLIEGNTTLEDLNDGRPLKQNSTGMISISIRKIIQKLGRAGEQFKDLEIKVYKSPLHSGEIHYVELPDKIVEIKPVTAGIAPETIAA